MEVLSNDTHGPSDSDIPSPSKGAEVPAYRNGYT